MKINPFVCIGLLTAVLAAGSAYPKEAAQLKVETLSSSQLEGVEGTDLIVSRVTFPPNTTLPTHWHPGEEFAYILEGSATLTMEGEEDTTFSAGELSVIPLKRVHSATSGDEGATILVFRVHQRGQPERVLVD